MVKARFIHTALLVLTVALSVPVYSFAQIVSVDSLQTTIEHEPGSTRDSIRAAVKDSIARSKQKQKSQVLDDPVSYESSDSTVWDFNGVASLFGSSVVKYQNIQLESYTIRMIMDSSIVYADGRKDSLDQMVETPIFKDGATPYNSNSMSYNFKTKKGYIKEIVTQQGDGYIVSNSAKKGTEDVYYVKDAVYTTCDQHEDPHFGLRITRAKIRPNKDVVFGPAYLEAMGVPLPVVVPFGFFPFTQSNYSSGVIIPSYGDEMARGFYLKDGGYYFAISDKMDLKLLGEIFTKGSWGVSAESNYKVRYKFSGNFFASYLVTKTGEKNMPDYAVSKDFKLRWSHRQDAKANPNRNFSASVNFATSSYERSNLSSLYNPALTSQSTRTSSVSYSRTFPSIGLSISASANLSQNMKDSTIAISLPSLSVSLNRIYPFKRKKAMGETKWWEKISFSYTGTLSNSVSSKDSELLKKNLIRDWSNGMRHSIPVSATFQLFNYINISPSFSYTSRWYTHKITQDWDYDQMAVQRDTVYGFYRVANWNASVTANTKLYGMYQPTNLWRKIFGDGLVMVRHVFTPSLSFSYAPDFSASRYGYYDTYTYTDANGECRTVEYSPFQSSLYGTVGKGKTGSVSLSVSNNLEMKVRDKLDSTKTKKKSLIDELGASLSYNLAAKTKPWGNLSTRLRLKLTKNYTFSFNATWATYAYELDDNGRVYVGDRTEWSYGRFGRFQGMSQNLSYTFSNNSIREWKEKIAEIKKRKEAKRLGLDPDELDDAESSGSGKNSGSGKSQSTKSGGGSAVDADGYLEYKLPWSLSVSYGITMRENTGGKFNTDRMRYPFMFTHNLNFSGNMKLTNKWNLSFSSGWDFVRHDFSTTTMSIHRDLHCFNLSASIALKPIVSYNITVQANSRMLADMLKLKKRSSSGAYVNWY